MNKQINTTIGLALIIIISVIAGGLIYLVNRSENKSVIATTSSIARQNPTLEKSPADSIAVGRPCDARELESYNGGGNIENTKGLQCYMYDDLSGRMLNDGKWVYSSDKDAMRKGVWVYPNHMNMPAFLALTSPSLFDTVSVDDLTKNWKTYNDSSGNFNFKFPKQWNVSLDESSPNLLTIEKINTDEANTKMATIEYYPNTKLENTEDYSKIKEAPDDWLVSDNSTDTFITTRHFDLNGSKALLVSRMNNFDLGGSSYKQTIYVSKPNSYLALTYEKYNDVNIDLPVEMLIKTIRFE